MATITKHSGISLLVLSVYLRDKVVNHMQITDGNINMLLEKNMRIFHHSHRRIINLSNQTNIKMHEGESFYSRIKSTLLFQYLEDIYVTSTRIQYTHVWIQYIYFNFIHNMTISNIIHIKNRVSYGCQVRCYKSNFPFQCTKLN